MEKTDELLRTKDRVFHILSESPDTRNSDKLLFIKLIQTFYEVTDIIRVDQIMDLPSFESVRRMRQKIQEAGQLVPTSWEVARQRRWLQDDWKRALGYHVTPAGQLEMVM